MHLKKNISKKIITKKSKYIRRQFYNSRDILVLLIRSSDLYKRWRQDVLREQGYKCQFCRSAKNIQVHHIIPLAKQVNEFLYRYGMKGEEIEVDNFLDIIEYYLDFWDIENGIVLCDFCHQYEHPERVLWGF